MRRRLARRLTAIGGFGLYVFPGRSRLCGLSRRCGLSGLSASCLLTAVLVMMSGCSKKGGPITQDLHVVMLDAVNKLRRTGCQCGTDFMPPAPDLVWDDTLREAADGHLKDMVEHGYFGHIAPDGSAPVQRAQALGYTGDYVGENIARGYFSVEEVMAAWKNSPDHCRAMLDSLYKEMGAGRLNDYWDQEFGRKD